MPRARKEKPPREIKPGSGARESGERSYSITVKDAAYNPRRDGRLSYANPYDEMMGDPPIGRRAIDKKEKQ